MTDNKIKEPIAKDEALKVAANMLNKLYHSDNSNPDAISLQAYLLTTEANKDYGKMFHMLEELRKFIVRLQLALKQNPGLCSLLNDALDHYGIFNPFPSTIFPKFSAKYAKQFGASCNYCGYWWIKDEWNTGRLDYLDWLIEQYKDDKTNIRKL